MKHLLNLLIEKRKQVRKEGNLAAWVQINHAIRDIRKLKTIKTAKGRLAVLDRARASWEKAKKHL